MRNSIKKRTIKILRTAAGKFFPHDEAYHAWLGHQYDVGSTLELSDEEGQQAIDAIDKMAKEKRRRAHGPRRGALRITFEQKEYIEGLFDDLDIPEGPRQLGFIKKQIGAAKAVDWLSNREASKVITGLKRFKKSQYSGDSNQNSEEN